MGVFSKWGTHRDLWGLIGIVSKSKSFVLVGKQDLGWIKKLIQNYSKVFITIHEQKLFRISDKSRFSHVIFDKKRLSYPSVYDQIPFFDAYTILPPTLNFYLYYHWTNASLSDRPENKVSQSEASDTFILLIHWPKYLRRRVGVFTFSAV